MSPSGVGGLFSDLWGHFKKLTCPLRFDGKVGVLLLNVTPPPANWDVQTRKSLRDFSDLAASNTFELMFVKPKQLKLKPPLLPRAIVALVYNVLKAFMEMNSTLFDELTATYKSDRQR